MGRSTDGGHRRTATGFARGASRPTYEPTTTVPHHADTSNLPPTLSRWRYADLRVVIKEFVDQLTRKGVDGLFAYLQAAHEVKKGR